MQSKNANLLRNSHTNKNLKIISSELKVTVIYRFTQYQCVAHTHFSYLDMSNVDRCEWMKQNQDDEIHKLFSNVCFIPFLCQVQQQRLFIFLVHIYSRK